jgi:magnesium-transporting ATPase (P-type)
VVVDTGAQTEIGRISGLLAEVEQLSTPLTRQMERFGKWLTGVIMAIALLVFAYGYVVQGMAFGDLFMAVVGLAVAAIPEGLPAVLTITLATGVQAMARRKAIVRRLPAIETIGAVSVICSDKTGTLTRNEMMVASVLTARHCFTVEGNGYAPQGKFFCTQEEQDVTQHPLLQRMGRAAALCNDAALQEDAQNGWCVEGDPMEGALLAFAAKAGAADVQEKRLDAIPFDARHRFMATLHADELFVKGAPEKLLELAQQQEGPDGPQPLDVGYWQHEAEAIAALGQRVLALGYKPVQQEALDFADVEQGVILLGMVGMIDPPRPEAMQAVKECHAAGIAVKMITGDHAATAAAIGRQIGLQQTQSVLSGQEIEQLDEAALREAVMATDIFARTSPEHKLRLVMALQAQGLIVAMTGDGVNDAPALKRADAGIAMGLKGSEAAKEAAELVLADDHFATIVAAVREGRTVYDNLKKVISWTLPTNGGEAMTILVALLFGLALPVTPVQILWVNLITAVTLGIALAFEPTEEKTMQRPPRAQDEALLSGSLVWMILLVSCLFAGFVFGVYNYVLAQGHPVEMARTMAVNTLVVLEIFNLFFIRNLYGTSLTWQMIRGTRVMWAVIVVITLAQFAFTYAPPLQKVFVTQGLPLSYGLMVVGCGVVLFVLLELEKQIRLRFWQRG